MHDTARMNEKPRRRLFRFNLPTRLVLFVMAAASLVWIAYSLNWIRQRREVISRAQANGAQFGPGDSVDAPGMLWLFGERGYGKVWISVDPRKPWENDGSMEAARLAKLFPEAKRFSTIIAPRSSEALRAKVKLVRAARRSRCEKSHLE